MTFGKTEQIVVYCMKSMQVWQIVAAKSVRVHISGLRVKCANFIQQFIASVITLVFKLRNRRRIGH